MQRLQNKTAIITGATGGIGAAAAKRFVEEGAKVFLIDLDAVALEKLAQSLSGQAEYQVADVTDAEATNSFMSKAVERYGRIDVAYLNAGVEGTIGPIVHASVQMFDRVFAVNVRGVWLGLAAAMSHMQTMGGGSIIVTSSTAGLRGVPNLAAYSASKHAAIGLMKSAALEGAPFNIRVNSVNPSAVQTRMLEAIVKGGNPTKDTSEVLTSMQASRPLKRFASSDEVASMVLFLASDEASYCTGGVYMVDGGFSAG